MYLFFRYEFRIPTKTPAIKETTLSVILTKSKSIKGTTSVIPSIVLDDPKESPSRKYPKTPAKNVWKKLDSNTRASIKNTENVPPISDNATDMKLNIKKGRTNNNISRSSVLIVSKKRTPKSLILSWNKKLSITTNNTWNKGADTKHLTTLSIILVQLQAR